jgi:hypothetical protein
MSDIFISHVEEDETAGASGWHGPADDHGAGLFIRLAEVNL